MQDEIFHIQNNTQFEELALKIFDYQIKKIKFIVPMLN